MPLSYAELEQFYEGLVARARARGITCAITSGMACVAFGVAQTTKDCVAEMKRTNREKDWPFATALGLRLLEAGDPRGWLHLFNHEVLTRTAETVSCPEAMIALRPALALLEAADDRLELALKGEIEFWNRLDRLRVRIYERAARPYRLCVKRDRRASDPTLAAQHQVRVEHAERLLPVSPLRQYGIERLIAEAKAEAARFLPSGALQWLPDASGCFGFLAE